MTWYLGVDGGGSGCRAAVADASGAVLGRGASGPANILTDPEQARTSILEAAEAALADASAAGEVNAVLGLAGANVPGTAEPIAGRLPYATVRIESDAVTTLKGALHAEDGIVCMLGTGSVFAVQRRGSVRTVGGWGYLIGDHGSGARLGLAALEQALLAHDGLAPDTPLLAALVAEAGGPAGLVARAHASEPAAFARLAPRIVAAADGGDPAAVAILGAALASVATAIDKLDEGEHLPVCLLGGLGPVYAERLGQRHRARIVAPRGGALEGAILMARGLA